LIERLFDEEAAVERQMASRQGPAAPARRPVRLTRRGRAVIVLISLVALFGIFSLGRVSSQAAAPPAAPRQVVVAPGETLWDLAVRSQPQMDPRLTVQALMSLNHLQSSRLTPGEVLLLPASSS
jgi:Tfp pilus assembly protein FimV